MKNLYFLFTFFLTIGLANAQTVTITDNGNGTGTTTWTKDKTYILDGLVFVNSGQTLTIEAGTVIKGKPGQTTDASALVVARGGKIFAKGTAEEPIIFTAEADDLANPFDIPAGTKGLWGGVIILGNAQLNSTPGESAIEGIPTTEPRGLYGSIDTDGDSIPDSYNNFDNSGTFAYCSIRYGGTDIGAGNEINGLTMGGVGSRTNIHHVEVIFNKDDGFEFFGGTVQTKYMIAAFCGDDCFDYDEGFRGKGQFWFAIQADSTGDRGGEHDGGTSPETGTPLATPQIYNATYIGRGQSEGTRAITFRDNAGGGYYNSIFSDYGKGIDIEILGSSEDSYTRYENGELKLEGNLFWNVAGNDPTKMFTITAAKYTGISISDSTAEVDAAKADVQTGFVSGGNDVANPNLRSISRAATAKMLDPRPTPGSAAYQNLAGYPMNDAFITPVNYKGAFSSATDHWARGWTLLEEMGYFPDVTPGTITVVDNTGAGTTDWTSNNTYILDGLVFVNSGDTLNIEAGTVIKGKPGQTTDASALVVARGGYINAAGTPTAPIIMTAEQDNVENPFDIPAGTKGLWGGLIILGNAGLNSTPGESAIEGIPTTEPRGLYGAIDTNNDSIPDSWDDTDNSGILSYISIRYGGTDIGAGNEINGMTFGGVGSGTLVDHIEVVFNKDDGYEFFGGTVQTKYLISAFCGDDCFDYDEGFRGKGQFWFAIQADSTGDRGGEHDGGTSPETGTPLATPHIYNATYIGRGESEGTRTITFRDNAGGEYHNSIFVDFGKGIDIEILGSSEDSYTRFENGELKLENNIFWDIAGNNADAIFTITAAKYTGISAADSTMEVDAAKAAVQNYFGTAGNEASDPLIASISRTDQVMMLDPRPSDQGPAYQNLGAYPANDDFFTEVSYKGAFSNSTQFWPSGWTLLDEMKYFPAAGTFTRIEKEIREQVLNAITLYPNPNQGVFNIKIENDKIDPVHVVIYDMVGNRVYENAFRALDGQVESSIDLSNQPAGMYIMRATQKAEVIGVSRIVKQ